MNEDAHEPIIPRALFDAVQASKTTQTTTNGRTNTGRILVGVARCAGCGHTLKVVTRTRADGSRLQSYFCKDSATAACNARAYVHAEALDAFACFTASDSFTAMFARTTFFGSAATGSSLT